MEQQKGAAGRHTGSPSTSNPSLQSFASIGDIRQAVLNAAQIEEHAGRAGFRRGRGRKWHCAIHPDKNPSCTVHHGRIRCWACSKSWNTIDCEMLASGQPFLKTLRAMAREYGIPVPAYDRRPDGRAREAGERREREERAFSFREGFLAVIDDVLRTEKAKLFERHDGPANERCIMTLTRIEQVLRRAASPFAVVRAYEAFNSTLPDLTTKLEAHGFQVRRDLEDFGFWFMDRLADMEDRL